MIKVSQLWIEKEGEETNVFPLTACHLIFLSGLWQAKPNVKWLLEFIQRGQRENKNITRELQLQPSNMTSVWFCAFDWGPTFNGRFWLQDKQTVIGLTQPSSAGTARQPEKFNSAAATAEAAVVLAAG